MITCHEARRLFDYDPATGWLTWRVRLGHNGVRAGDRAGSNTMWCRMVQVNGQSYAEADIIWLWMTGKPPLPEIDHADCNAFNNVWSNLRKATSSQNKVNRRNYRPGQLKGAYLVPSGRYAARICFNGTRIFIGTYNTEQQAHDAYVAKSRQLHGPFHRAS